MIALDLSRKEIYGFIRVRSSMKFTQAMEISISSVCRNLLKYLEVSFAGFLCDVAFRNARTSQLVQPVFSDTHVGVKSLRLRSKAGISAYGAVTRI